MARPTAVMRRRAHDPVGHATMVHGRRNTRLARGERADAAENARRTRVRDQHAVGTSGENTRLTPYNSPYRRSVTEGRENRSRRYRTGVGQIQYERGRVRRGTSPVNIERRLGRALGNHTLSRRRTTHPSTGTTGIMVRRATATVARALRTSASRGSPNRTRAPSRRPEDH